jgi:Ca2+-binding RTX toxin-like protein
MQGGVGDDTYVVDEVGDKVLEAANAGTDTVRSGIDYTLGGNLENLVLTGLERSQRYGQCAGQRHDR